MCLNVFIGRSLLALKIKSSRLKYHTILTPINFNKVKLDKKSSNVLADKPTTSAVLANVYSGMSLVIEICFMTKKNLKIIR